jgi:hypothetical protein
VADEGESVKPAIRRVTLSIRENELMQTSLLDIGAQSFFVDGGRILKVYRFNSPKPIKEVGEDLGCEK